jgi:hydroxymethylglutaryl-CoA reductase
MHLRPAPRCLPRAPKLSPSCPLRADTRRRSVVSLPLGLGLNFVINGERIEAVPMAVEEPSVIAATSGAAKLVSAGGGFKTGTTANVMFGQIQLIGIGDGKPAAVEAAAAAITAAKSELIDEANTYCASMLARGGGVVDITTRMVVHREGSGLEFPVAAGGLQLVVHVHIDVQASMGANLINTVVEGVSDTVFAIAAEAAPSENARCGVRILSNMCSERRARASFRVPATELSYKGYSGAEVGRRIVETWRFAFDDPFRAVTHNKGVMNGIDAVAVATGQDWRALEAGAHAYSTAGLGRDAYLPLTSYSWHVPESGVEEDGWLEGVLDMPMACGTVGGAVHSVRQAKPCCAASFSCRHRICAHVHSRSFARVCLCLHSASNLPAVSHHLRPPRCQPPLRDHCSSRTGTKSCRYPSNGD